MFRQVSSKLPFTKKIVKKNIRRFYSSQPDKTILLPSIYRCLKKNKKKPIQLPGTNITEQIKIDILKKKEHREKEEANKTFAHAMKNPVFHSALQLIHPPLAKKLYEGKKLERYFYLIPDNDFFEQSFQQLKKIHPHWCHSPDAFENFKIIFYVLKINADFFEVQKESRSGENNTEVLNQISKLLFLCQDKNPELLFKDFARYLKNHYSDCDTPVKYALQSELPPYLLSSPYKKDWGKLTHQGGKEIWTRILPLAEKIEKHFNNAPKNIMEAALGGALVSYKNADQHPKLALLCFYYKKQEFIFNRCLEIEKTRKTEDALPNIIVDGNICGHPGYFLIKIPPNAPEVYLLGSMTECCQDIGSEAEQCAIDGATLKNNGFYGLFRANNKTFTAQDIFNPDGSINYSKVEMMGQGYAWLSRLGNLTFDSFENKSETYDAISVSLITHFAETVTSLYPDILRVTIGCGGNTPKALRKVVLNDNENEKIKEGKEYPDSQDQALIYLNQEKQTLLHEALEKALGFSLAIKLPSAQHYKWAHLILNTPTLQSFLTQQNIADFSRPFLMGYRSFTLEHILASLPCSRTESFIAELGSSFYAMLWNVHMLKEVLKIFPLQQTRLLLLQELGEKLPEIMTNEKDFINIIHLLNPSTQIDFIKILGKEGIQKILHDKYTIYKVARSYLPCNVGVALEEVMKVNTLCNVPRYN